MSLFELSAINYRIRINVSKSSDSELQKTSQNKFESFKNLDLRFQTKTFSWRAFDWRIFDERGFERDCSAAKPLGSWQLDSLKTLPQHELKGFIDSFANSYFLGLVVPLKLAFLAFLSMVRPNFRIILYPKIGRHIMSQKFIQKFIQS